MGNRIKFAALGLAIMAYGPQAMAQDAPDAGMVIATVNGHKITLGHMILLREELPDQFRDYPDDILFPALYSQLVEQTLLANMLTGDAPARVVFGVENAERDLKSGLAVQNIYDEYVSEDAIQAAYQDAYIDADLGLEYNASHILVATEAEATDLQAELDGGLDFAEAAKIYSTGPSSTSGGSLGWFGRGAMVGPFDAAVAAMETGARSQPVQTKFGWHIIKLNDTRPVVPPSLDDVSEELSDELGGAALDLVIGDLRETAEIERLVPDDFDTSVLSDSTLLEK